MFVPAASFVVLTGLYVCYCIRMIRSRNWKEARRSLWFIMYFGGTALFFGLELYNNRNNPAAWGIGRSILCKVYGC